MSEYGFAASTRTFQINKYAAQHTLKLDIEDPGFRWRMQQAIFETRMEMLKGQIREGVVGVRPAQFEIWIRVQQDVVDEEAERLAGGKINIPYGDQRAIQVYSYDRQYVAWGE